ncbi:phosphatidylcholine:ceramide cholinephosphotransferase 1-like [Ambystoma mexicanum]|uniref:phosphatidylcholine:ceramide cholinephosphotransferase 1-like n=1 Tax=Ambystoma mexicanum TaxID=8296 RepID=UPI0037E989F4
MEKCNCRSILCTQMTSSGPHILPAVSSNSDSNLQKRYRCSLVEVIDVGVRYPPEWRKTLIMLLYAVLSTLLSSLVVVLVNNWVPAQEIVSPLPDLFPRSFGSSAWAFQLSEFCSFLLLTLWLIQWFLLRYKSIVGRRFFFILGTLHLYRTLTTYVTVLPVPSQYIICENKVSGGWEVILKQTFKLMSNGGFFLRRSPTFCGDYMYSGQAATLILTYMFIKTYSPDIFWVYQLFCWLLSVTGVVSIMFTHTHYTLDVIAAYFVTTRIFWWYHTLTNNQDIVVWKGICHGQETGNDAHG